MAAPTEATFSAAALVAANTSLKNLIDAGSAAGAIKIRDAADVLLSTIPLTYPCGSVDGATGRLTITPAGIDASPDAAGTAAYGEFCDSNGLVHLSLPAQVGSAAVSGVLVMDNLSVASGGTVEVTSATVG